MVSGELHNPLSCTLRASPGRSTLLCVTEPVRAVRITAPPRILRRGTCDNRNVDRAGRIQDVLRIGCGFCGCAVAPRGHHASENNVLGVHDVTERKCVIDATVGIDKNVSQTDPASFELSLCLLIANVVVLRVHVLCDRVRISDIWDPVVVPD